MAAAFELGRMLYLSPRGWPGSSLIPSDVDGEGARLRQGRAAVGRAAQTPRRRGRGWVLVGGAQSDRLAGGRRQRTVP